MRVFLQHAVDDHVSCPPQLFDYECSSFDGNDTLANLIENQHPGCPTLVNPPAQFNAKMALMCQMNIVFD